MIHMAIVLCEFNNPYLNGVTIMIISQKVNASGLGGLLWGTAATMWNSLSRAEKEEAMDAMEDLFPDGIDLQELNDEIVHYDLLDEILNEDSSYRESYRRNLKRRVSALESHVRSSKIRRR